VLQIYPILISSVSVALNQHRIFLFLHSFKTTCVNKAVIYILYVLKLKPWLGSYSVSNSSSMRHGHCSATIAFILDIYV